MRAPWSSPRPSPDAPPQVALVLALGLVAWALGDLWRGAWVTPATVLAAVVLVPLLGALALLLAGWMLEGVRRTFIWSMRLGLPR